MGGDDPPPSKGLFDHTKNRGGLFIILNQLALESQEKVIRSQQKTDERIRIQSSPKFPTASKLLLDLLVYGG